MQGGTFILLIVMIMIQPYLQMPKRYFMMGLIPIAVAIVQILTQMVMVLMRLFMVGMIVTILGMMSIQNLLLKNGMTVLIVIAWEITITTKTKMAIVQK